MTRRKDAVMFPYKWADVKNRVTKAMEKYMFNFKEGSKRKMMKVQYFKHPDIAHYLYDIHLATCGRLPWNDKVPLYFAKLFYAELFLQMKPNYNDLPSEFFGPGKGRLCDHRGIMHDADFPRLEPPLVS